MRTDLGSLRTRLILQAMGGVTAEVTRVTRHGGVFGGTFAVVPGDMHASSGCVLSGVVQNEGEGWVRAGKPDGLAKWQERAFPIAISVPAIIDSSGRRNPTGHLEQRP